jgi:excinuclease UvrABC helicase subunit UvrB
MEGARVIKGSTKKKKEDIEKIVTFKIQDDTVENITDTLNKLEDEMFALAKKMEFEKAAVCRDKINSLKRKLIDL